VLHLSIKQSYCQNQLNTISEKSAGEDWETAKTAYFDLKGHWDANKYLVQLNHGEQSYAEMTKNMERLEAAVIYHEKYETQLHVKEIKTLVDNLFQAAPQH
jgi:hypothetical protein